jgi:hypothetical protein
MKNNMFHLDNADMIELAHWFVFFIEKNVPYQSGDYDDCYTPWLEEWDDEEMPWYKESTVREAAFELWTALPENKPIIKLMED